MRRASPALSRIVRGLGILAFVAASVACSRADPPLRPAPEPASSIAPASTNDDDDFFSPTITHERLEDFERGDWRIDGRFDVDGDGIEDAFFHNPGWCGSGGCTTPLVVSHGGRFSARFEAFAMACWPAADVVEGHASIDCIERFDTCGPYLFVVRARWAPDLERWVASSFEVGEDPSPPRCAHAVLADDVLPRVWPVGEIEILVERDDDRFFVEDARALADTRRGPFRPMLLDARARALPHFEHEQASDVVSCMFGDELPAATSVVLDARVVDAFGEAWVRSNGSWLRERDVVCVTR